MQIIISGGAGFLGQRLAAALLASNVPFDDLVLADKIMPPAPVQDRRLSCQQVDLSDSGQAKALIGNQTRIVFHLAAVVSSQAEKEFELGWQVNLDATRYLLEACRLAHAGIRFVFTSSLAVFGGTLPAVVSEDTPVTPRSSYGIQKAMSELLVNDYTRKGFIDGIVLRLPTICVRPGKPNQAASSFVSSIIREPLRGERAVCPVSPNLVLWLSSPLITTQNLLSAATMNTELFGSWRTINLPGISVTVQQMLDALLRNSDAATVARVEFTEDPAINRIVASWPGVIDNTRSLALGFGVDRHMDDLITQHIQEQRTA